MAKQDLNLLWRIIGGILVAFPLWYTLAGNELYWIWFFLSMVIGLVLLSHKFH